MIKRHNGCRGLTLWRWGRFQIELWFAPKGEVIEPHIHSRIDSSIVFLVGSMVGTIGGKTGLLEWPADCFRRFNVPAGVKHSATITAFCMFANVERWKGDVTSAADDFTAL